jgi:hypothetical protein
LARIAPGVLGPGSTEGEILRKRDLTIIEGARTLTLSAVWSLARAQPAGQRCRGHRGWGRSDPEMGSLLASMCLIPDVDKVRVGGILS